MPYPNHRTHNAVGDGIQFGEDVFHASILHERVDVMVNFTNILDEGFRNVGVKTQEMLMQLMEAMLGLSQLHEQVEMADNGWEGILLLVDPMPTPHEQVHAKVHQLRCSEADSRRSTLRRFLGRRIAPCPSLGNRMTKVRCRREGCEESH
mgnify:CR=1 FL=1